MPFENVFRPILMAYPLNLISSIIVTERMVLIGILICMWLENLWSLFLSLRQHSVLKTENKVPAELKGHFTKEKFEKSRSYALDRNHFSIINSQVDLCITTAMIVFKFHAVLWSWSGHCATTLGLPLDDYQITQSCTYLFINSLIDIIIQTPFRLYSTFVIEEKHGFNNQTLGFFVKDEIKKFILSQVLMFPVTSGILAIVILGGDYFFVYAWAFTTAVLLIMLTVYPALIAPLFDKYTPLPEGELRTRIEDLAKQLKFPLKKLFVVDGSKRSAHSNAYLYGVYNSKRIVLFDTLIKGYKSPDADDKKEDNASLTPEERVKKEKQQKEKEERGCNNDEVVAIIGHELGHWKCNHLVRAIIIMLTNTFFGFLVFAQLFKYKTLYRAFGFSTEQPIMIGFTIIIGYILLPYKAVVGFLSNIFSRYCEYEADRFSKTLGMAKPLHSALIKLGSDNLSFPLYDKLYSAWHHSHPTVVERIRALSKED